MSPEAINEGLPENYKSLMPVQFLKCAELVSQNKIREGVKVFRHYFKEKELDTWMPKYVATYKHFKQTHKNCKQYIHDNDLKDPNHLIEEYIYESVISTIWWDYMHDRPADYQ